MDSGGASGHTQTDAQGRYREPHDGGHIVLFASKRTSKSVEHRFELARNESVEHDFVLPPVTTVFFKVRDEEGQVPKKYGLDTWNTMP